METVAHDLVVENDMDGNVDPRTVGVDYPPSGVRNKLVDERVANDTAAPAEDDFPY